MGSNKVKGKRIRNKNNNDLVKDEKLESVNVDDLKEELEKEYESMNLDDSKEEQDSNDKILENEDNMSLAMILFVLVMCLVVGIVVGYLLYRLAINNSNVLYNIGNFIKIKMM